MKRTGRKKFTAVLMILFTVVLLLFSIKALKGRKKDSTLKINEVCTSNFSVSRDDLNGYEDYIEIVNAGDSEAVLTGYKIRVADEGGSRSYEIPECILESGEYRLIFFAEEYNGERKEYDPDESLDIREYVLSGSFFKEEKSSELHAPINLSKNGCNIFLINPVGDIVDEVEVPYLDYDMTYSRFPNTGSGFEVRSGTPGLRNDLSLKRQPRTLGEPVFSAESGFYKDNIKLTLSAAPGQNIYYTLDGSDPDETSLLYTAPIEIGNASEKENLYSAIEDVSTLLPSGNKRYAFALPDKKVDKGTVVRAAVVDSTGNMGKIATETYFVGLDEEKYAGTAVLSLVSDPEGLFGNERGIYVLGDAGHEYRKTHPGFVYWGEANYRFHGREWEREADITVLSEDHSSLMQDKAGIRVKGNWSRCFPQKSLNLYARNIYSGADRFSESLLPGDSRESSLTLFSGGNNVDYKIVDRLGAAFAKELNVTSMSFRPVHLFLNGEYWGIEYLTDKYSSDFLRERYGVDPGNVVIIKDNLPEEGGEEASKLYEELRYMAFSGLSGDEEYSRFREVMDIDSMTDYYALEIYIGAQNDWPTRNVALWRSKDDKGSGAEDGKWRYMLFDLNQETMNLSHMDVDNIALALESDAIFAAAFENKDFKNLFFDKLKDLEKGACSPENAEKEISKIVDSSASHMALWYERFYNGAVGEEYYQERVERTREYFRRRPEAVERLIEKYNGTD